MWRVILRVALLLAVAVALIQGKRGNRVIGGSPAAKGQFPYVVAVVRGDGIVECQGVILNKNTVIVGAWCLTGDSGTEAKKDRKIVAGSISIDDVKAGKPQSREIKEAKLHPCYLKTRGSKPGAFDLAKVTVDKDFEINDDVKPIEDAGIKIVSLKDKLGSGTGNIAGYGAREQYSDASANLHYFKGKIVAAGDCEKKYTAKYDGHSMFCLRGTDEKKSAALCSFDHSAAFIPEDTAAGKILAGLAVDTGVSGSCDNPTDLGPDMLTDITKLACWIKDEVKDWSDDKCTMDHKVCDSFDKTGGGGGEPAVPGDETTDGTIISASGFLTILALALVKLLRS